MTVGGLTGGTFRRLTATGDDDVEPTYLPAGRGYVFTSNRQTKSSVNQALGRSYKALDEYERETVFNLHTMDADGGNVHADLVQPEPRPQPEDPPERRHHVLALGPRRRPQPLQGLPRQAGRHRHVRALRRAQRRQQLPAPARHGPEGPVRRLHHLRPDAAVGHQRRRRPDVRSTPPTSPSRTRRPTRASPASARSRRRRRRSTSARGLSQYGRVTTPFPLWDGTDRVLVALHAVRGEPRRASSCSCATLTAAEQARLGEERLAEDIAADELQDNVRPSYAIYMFDPKQQTFLIVAAPPPGFMNTHPVAIQPRTEPNATAADQRRRDAGGAEPRPARSAQRLRHRRPRPHGHAAS